MTRAEWESLLTRREVLENLLAKVEAGEWWGDMPRPDALRTDLCWKAFNGSLDAAKTLQDVLLPDWTWTVESDEQGFSAYLYNKLSVGKNKGAWLVPATGRSKHSPARAWLIAQIDALITKVEDK